MEITIKFKDKDEETLIENLLKKMKISFTKKEDENDFELTKEMKNAIDEALKEDKSQFADAFESLEESAKKYGI